MNQHVTIPAEGVRTSDDAEVFSAEVFSSVVLGPGGAGCMDLFTTPRGQRVPRLCGTSGDQHYPAITREDRRAGPTTAWGRFWAKVFDIRPVIVNVTVPRPAVLDAERIFPTQTSFTTNMMKASELGFDMAIKGIRADLIGCYAVDADKILSLVTYDLNVGDEHVRGALRDLPRDLSECPVLCAKHDVLECHIEVSGAASLDLDGCALLRVVLTGIGRREPK